MNGHARTTSSRRIRVLGIQGDRELEKVLRGAARTLNVEAIGIAWPPHPSLHYPGAHNARSSALLTRLGGRDAVLHVGAVDEIKALTGLSRASPCWLAAARAGDDAALFVVGDGNVALRTLKPALQDFAGAVGALISHRLAQQRLAICAAQLEHAEHLAQTGHWCFDVATRSYDYSPMAKLLHGIPPDGGDDLEAAFKSVHPDDIPLIERTFAKLQMAPRGAFTCEYRVLRSDGQGQRIVSSIVGGRVDEHGVLTMVTGACRDVTDERHLRDALETSEAHFRRLAETCSDIIVCYAPTGVVTYASPAVKAVLGYEEYEVVGRTIEFIMSPEQRAIGVERFKDCVRGRLADGYEAYTYKCQRKDGSEIWLESRIRAEREPMSGLTVEVRDSLRDVTARVRAEAALVEQQKFMEVLADGSADLIVRFALDGSIVFASQASAEVIGVEASELVGRKTWEFIHPDDHRLMRKAYQAILDDSDAAPPRLEYRLIRPDGDIRYIEASPTAIRDPKTQAITQFFDVSRDITERCLADLKLKAALERAETAMQKASRSEARYRLLADTARDLTIQYDMHGVIRYASPSSKHLGYTPRELVGHRIEDFVHPDDRESALQTAHQNFTIQPDERAAPAEMRVRRKDGDYVWLEGNPGTIRNEAGRVVMVNTTLRDITDRRKLMESLVDARHQAESANAAKSVFLANMSHELRTPLTSVIGFSQQILMQHNLSREVQNAADRIAAGGKALLTTINDILDFSKIENGDVKISPRPTSVEDAVGEVVELLDLGAQKKGLTLQAWSDGSLPPHLLLDPDRLRQILLNLTGNAVKFTDEGSVDVSLRYRVDDERLRIEVKDTGSGISEDDLQRLFKRFSQVDDTISRRHAGTGLGLAICKGLAEAMGGRIGVESEVGAGSTFWFELHAPITASAESDMVGPATALPAGARILVVDDHIENLEVISCILTAAGGCVWKATSGAEALEIVAKGTFDIILTDRRMPIMDGLELTRRIRSTAGPNRYAPVLLCTADLASLQPSEESLFDGVLIKPITPRDLIGRTSAILAQDAPLSGMTEVAGERPTACVECQLGQSASVDSTPGQSPCRQRATQ